ncbi:hypothetical protein P7C70_g2776, partial [Phenoliferia sp. Uapishka_3]
MGPVPGDVSEFRAVRELVYILLPFHFTANMNHHRAPDNAFRPDLPSAQAQQVFLDQLATFKCPRQLPLYSKTNESTWAHPDLPPSPPLPNAPFWPALNLSAANCSDLVLLDSGRKLYDLQAEAVAATMGGQNTFIISPTSSGKTAMAYSGLVALNQMSRHLFECRAGRQIMLISPRDGNEVQIAAEARAANVHAIAINRTMLTAAEEEMWCLGPEMNEGVAMEALGRKGSTCLWRFLAWVLDEAHCVSEDVAYRPIYGNIGQLRSKFVRERFPVPWLALTATATKIIKLRLTKALCWKKVFFRQLSNQRAIKFMAAVLEDGPKSVLFAELDWIVTAPNVGSVIIFVDTIPTINNLVLYLRSLIPKDRDYEIEALYSILSTHQQTRVQDQQRSGRTRVIVTSSLMEMGFHLEFDWGVQYGAEDNMKKLTGPKLLQRVGRVGRRFEQVISVTGPPPPPPPPRPPPRFIMYVNSNLAGQLRTAQGPIPKSHLAAMSTLDDIMRGFLYANCRHRGVNAASENPEVEWLVLAPGECCDLCDKRDGLAGNPELAPALFVLISDLNGQFTANRFEYIRIEKLRTSKKAPIVRVRTDAEVEAEDGCEVTGLGALLAQLGTYEVVRKKKTKRVRVVEGDWGQQTEGGEGEEGPPLAEFSNHDFDLLFDCEPFTSPKLRIPPFDFTRGLLDPNTPIRLVTPILSQPAPLRLAPPRRPKPAPVPAPSRPVLASRSSNIPSRHPEQPLQPPFQINSHAPKRKLRENATPGDRAEKTPRSPASNANVLRTPAPVLSYTPSTLRSPPPPSATPAATTAEQEQALDFFRNIGSRA